MSTPPTRRVLLPLVLVTACGGGGGSDESIYGSSTQTGATLGESNDEVEDDATDASEATAEGSSSEGTMFDLGDPTLEGGDGDGDCTLPHTPCDAGSSDPFALIGLGCPDETSIVGTIDAHPDGMGVRSSFGATSSFDALEGAAYFVLSTGHVAELDDEPTTRSITATSGSSPATA